MEESRDEARALWHRARSLIPGGVNSPVRAFQAVGGDPVFIQRGLGPRVWDTTGREYIDLVMSWGALIHGHAHPRINAAAARAVERGSSFGMPTPGEVELAAVLVDAFPFMDRVRLVNSGTEATMSAVRLARAATGRDLIVKFAGCYHGHADGFLAEAGSGALTLGHPSSPGVPEASARLTRVLPYQDIEAARDLFGREGDQIAAVIVEPVAGNMGVIVPDPAFLPSLRQLTEDAGALLVFDEVITGFRTAWGGWSTRTGIRPDLITLGKIIGGGFPLAAYGGPAELMDRIAPAGPVYQAGTLSGNPVAVAAGHAALELIREQEDFYERLDRATGAFAGNLREIFHRHGIPAVVQHTTGMLTVFFTDHPVRNLHDARTADTRAYARLFHALLDQGVHLPPSAFEGWFLSSAHEPGVLDAVCERLDTALKDWPP